LLRRDQYQRGNDEHVKVHREGLRELIRLRGDDCPPLVKLSIALTQAMCDFALQRSVGPDSVADEMNYPTHPFPPNLTKSISELPDGLVELALSGRLSTQVINLLYRITRILKQGAEASSHAIMVDFMKLSLHEKATPLEKKLAVLVLLFGIPIGLGAGVKHRGTTQRAHHTTWDLLLTLNKQILAGVDDSLGIAFSAWAVHLAVCVLNDTSFMPERDPEPRSEMQDRLLRYLNSTAPKLDLIELRRMVQRYFWQESLESELVRMHDRLNGLTALDSGQITG
jgi:hypothetical protein